MRPEFEEEERELMKDIGCAYEDEDGEWHNEYYEEYFITDYDCDFDARSLGEYISIEQLNDIAERIEKFDEDLFEVIQDEQYSDVMDAIDKRKWAKVQKLIDQFPYLLNLFDDKGNLVGNLQTDGTIKDLNGKIIGQVDEKGNAIDANNNVIGGMGLNWYEKAPSTSAKKDDFVPVVGTLGEKKEKLDKKYRKSLNIALTPDGGYLGEIMDDGTVVDKKGRVVGQKMPDGLIVDKDGTLIGIEEIKKPKESEIFVPAGSFGEGSAYGIGVGPGDNLGPGGGYGPGERYNQQRSAALAVAQGQRRQNMQVGKISTNVRKEAFDGMQKDWTEQGIEKSLSSWRVDMSQMILADKPIPAVLARSIDSNNPTPVTAFVERNVYAEEGRNILIPAGSRFIGELGGLSPTSEASSESAKVQISWQRLIRPDGSMFKFDGLTADAQGRGGALGYMDKQLFKRYTMPVMTTVLTSTMAYLMATDDDGTGDTESSKQEAANDARQNFLDQMNQMFEQILQDKSSIQAMSYVPAGTRIIIFPKVDLWLRTVENDADAAEYEGKPKVLIDDQARLRENSGSNAGGSSVSTTSDNGQVSYQEENGEKPKSVPLIADDRFNDNKKNQQNIVPPPPPSSSVSMSSGGQNNSANISRPGTTESGQKNSNNSVPQLF